MKTIIAAGTALAVLAGAIAGYRIGAGTWPSLRSNPPRPTATEGSTRAPTADRAILYWQHPDGDADYSQAAKKTADGREYVPVYEDQEADFTRGKWEKPKGERKIVYYRNPMGLPDTSPVPKKDWMGMDYIPVYEGEGDTGHTVKISPGRLQRTGVKTAVVGKSPLTQFLKAPGVVAFDETRLSVVAMRFDGYINKVMPVTSGTHVHKGEPLMSVFGQDLLNAGVQIIIEEVTGWRGPERGEAVAAPGARDPRGAVVWRTCKYLRKPSRRSKSPAAFPMGSLGSPLRTVLSPSVMPSMAKHSRPAKCCSGLPIIPAYGCWPMSLRQMSAS
jgi:Cu(I)/Ag(I) efflux system membrane fusion protein